MLKKTNIEDKLRALKHRHQQEQNILHQVMQILKKEQQHEDRIAQELDSINGSVTNTLQIDRLDPDRIYHLDHIREICIDYRLRFLSSGYFKGTIPPEAVIEIKRLEKQHGNTLEGFKIMAPSKLFKLENADDPLLFAPIGSGYYYLIHKWGNDLHPLRKYMVLPFKGLGHLTVTIILISLVLTALTPLKLFTPEVNSSSFWLIFMFMFKMIGSIVIFYGFALGKNFNPAIWNSRFYNS